MKIFVGMDLGSKGVAYCVMDERGRMLDRSKMGWERSEWERVLGRYGREQVEAAFETGPEGYRAKGVLEELQGMEELEKGIQQQVLKAGYGERVKLLQSVPGIGEVTSRAVVAYAGNGLRFKSGRKFAAYVGLTPTVDQTGVQAARLGHITRQGPSVLRRLFVQAAQTASRTKAFQRTRWWKWFHRLQARRGRKIAVVALARKLAEVCYAIIRDGEAWNEKRLWPMTP